MRISLQDVQLLMLGLLRCESVMAVAVEQLKPSHFRISGAEKVYRAIFEIAATYFASTHQLIPAIVLTNELIRQFEAGQHQYSAEHIAAARDLIQQAFDPRYDALETNSAVVAYIKKLLLQFLVERHVTDFLTANASNISMSSEELITSMYSRFQEVQRVDEEPSVDPMSAMTSLSAPGRMLTHARWYDELTGGLRESGGEIIGLIGGPGWGKTTCAMHLAVCLAKQQVDVLYFSYEQSVSNETVADEFLHKIISSAAGISVARLIEIKKQPQSITEFERKLLDTEGQFVSRYLHCYDMSGYNPTAGFGGIAELERYLRSWAAARRKPRLVVIDWFGCLLAKRENAKIDDAMGLRRLVRQEHQTALVLTAKYNTSMLLLEQASTQAVERRPGQSPKQTDVQEAKNFTQLIQQCIHISGRPNEQGMCTLATSKVRTGPVGSVVCRANWPLNRFEVVDGVEQDPRDQSIYRPAGETGLTVPKPLDERFVTS